MPSKLVDDVRHLIRERADDGRPLTMPERALLLGTILPPTGADRDVVDELNDAITVGRRVLLDHASELGAEQRAAVRRLLAASRAVLDHTPSDDTRPPAHRVPLAARGGRPYRADVDG